MILVVLSRRNTAEGLREEKMASNILNEVVAANAQYVATFGKKGELALPPARRFAILTCMDARLDPAKYAGLSEGDAHVIRNAGGRASDDAIRSLVISHKLLGTVEWFVVHHTNCGMELFSATCLRTISRRRGSTERNGRIPSTAAAARLAISSNGTPSPSKRRACCRT